MASRWDLLTAHQIRITDGIIIFQNEHDELMGWNWSYLVMWAPEEWCRLRMLIWVTRAPSWVLQLRLTHGDTWHWLRALQTLTIFVMAWHRLQLSLTLTPGPVSSSLSAHVVTEIRFWKVWCETQRFWCTQDFSDSWPAFSHKSIPSQ